MVATTDFLGRLDETTRAALMAQATRYRLGKGAFVYCVSDPGDTVHFLLSGRTKTCKFTPDGREIILWFGFPGEVFGLLESPQRKGRMVSVETCEPCEIARMSSGSFRNFLGSRPEVSQLLVQIVAFRLGMLANRLVYFAADDAETRIAKLLVNLAARYHGSGDGPEPSIGLTHQEIADLTGVQRQTATRILGRMAKCGALSMRYRRISIRNHDLLSRFTAGPR
ncbi:MAG: Crp/Fnr family transcriptional regulator [Burkholderiales bacterium]|nr:Crp/Fnr family transcriptional regulator [Burkholderiales bacterium]MCW5575716.1 Crp/Fnr family transcriptional regulator [Burkholderiales bacterium]MCW5604112.1 Crp/Fnr family transcriptional regulator [Burkholderiales bacterium]